MRDVERKGGENDKSTGCNQSNRADRIASKTSAASKSSLSRVVSGTFQTLTRNAATEAAACAWRLVADFILRNRGLRTFSLTWRVAYFILRKRGPRTVPF